MFQRTKYKDVLSCNGFHWFSLKRKYWILHTMSPSIHVITPSTTTYRLVVGRANPVMGKERHTWFKFTDTLYVRVQCRVDEVAHNITRIWVEVDRRIVRKISHVFPQ